MTATAWAHLPNAKHIDRILAAVRRSPNIWAAGWDDAKGYAYAAVWAAPTALARNPARHALYYAIQEVPAAATKSAALDATFALIAWDDCAYILDLHPNVVRLMAASGNQPAILMEAAAIAMHEEPKP